jgi:RNA polymerase sigma-70 factor (ECF subfamily)
MPSILAFSSGTPPSYGDLQRLTDEQLMARLQAGCHDALAVLYDRYHRLVLSIALKIVRDPGEAEDVVQIVFLDIFRAVAQFDPSKGTTKMWLLQYAYHRAMGRKQYLNVRKFYSQEDLEELEVERLQQESVVGKLATAELKQTLREGLASLNGAQRRVIQLAADEGFSMKEIAEKTGESVVNVRHHYYRALRKLRSFIAGPAVGKAIGDE